MRKAVVVAQRADLSHVAGLAREMHRHHDLRQAALGLGALQLLRQSNGAHVVGARIDVDEIDRGAAIKTAIRGRDERVRRRPQPVARTQIEREIGDVQRSRRITDHATACRAPQASVSAASKRGTPGPWVSQSERSTATTASMSSGWMSCRP